MNYSLEHKDEAKRLELQGTFSKYDVSLELKDIILTGKEKILDAGCGSGLGLRFLKNKYPEVVGFGCDQSQTRIVEAKEIAEREGLTDLSFFTSTLEKISTSSGYFDFVLCRFVFEHLLSPSQIAEEFFRILKPGAKVCVVDLDGIVFNLYTSNQELRGLLDELRDGWETDLFIGRKIPAILTGAGFQNISWRMETMDFQGRDLKNEKDLTIQRFDFIRPTLVSIFGSGEKADRFSSLYVDEMMKKDSTLFYNKFIVEAQKPFPS